VARTAVTGQSGHHTVASRGGGDMGGSDMAVVGMPSHHDGQHWGWLGQD
jgi:hypothetical protein